jgi:hypothetical protein
LQSEEEGVRRQPVSNEEANIRARGILRKNPNATARMVAGGAGIALGRVPKLPAWQARPDKEGRQNGQGARLKKHRLTDKMLARMGVTDDPVARLEAEEAAGIDSDEATWRYLLENATQEERSRLNALTHEERRGLIAVTREQIANHEGFKE